jgi:TatD DNase family protein
VLVDTHAHLDDALFDADRPQVIERAAAAGVEAIVAVGTTADSSEVCLTLAQQYAQVWASVGLQPNHVSQAREDDWRRIERLATAERAIAIGETGLDRYWDFTPFEMQQDFFSRHIELAWRLELPLIIHMRDCELEMLEMLRTARRKGPLRGVMHSFTGSAETADACLEMGLHISFAGMVTYKKSAELRACAATVPADRILVETDSPYLSPEPVRNIRRNEPAHVRHIAARLAELRNERFEHFASRTSDNARRLFGLHGLKQE